MYVLNKHVHALNFLTISTDRSDFPEHVRVGRLIQKKIALVISTLQTMNINLVALLCLRFSSASPPLLVRFFEWDLKGI